MQQCFVYILCSKRNGTLYIGITNNVNRRVEEHKKGLISGFTSKYGVNKLVYAEEYNYVYDALEREKQLKRSNRAVKIHLIDLKNKIVCVENFMHAFMIHLQQKIKSFVT